MAETIRQQPDAARTGQARRHLKEAEAGDRIGAAGLDEVRKVNPGGEEAAEQEASDGPDGRGLSR
jgi:hypothetical protein